MPLLFYLPFAYLTGIKRGERKGIKRESISSFGQRLYADFLCSIL
jgi:hypothetical protein